MKKHFILFALSAFIIFGCGDDDDAVNTLPPEEAAPLIGSTVAASFGGSAGFGAILAGIDELENPNGREKANCGIAVEIDTTINLSQQNFIFEFDYQLSLLYTCNSQDVAESLVFSANLVAVLDNASFSSNSDASVDWVVTGVSDPVVPFVFNGASTTNTTVTLKDEGVTQTIQLAIMTEGLTFDKQSLAYTAGTMTVTLSGNGPEGAFVASATITVTGTNRGTMLVGDRTFTLDLVTGLVS